MLKAVESRTAILSLSGVSKSFGATRVLNGVDIDLSPGTILGLVGPNAAGKTTLLSILTGLLPPDAGRICLDGEEVNFDRQPDKRRSFGLMLNGRLLVPELKPAEYFDFLASMYGLERSEARRQARDFADALSLTPHMEKPIKQLSAGTQKKVEFIAALLHQPRILVFDEPFEAIDPPAVADLSRLTQEFVHRTGAAAIISTHVLPYVRPLATEILLLWSGKLHDPDDLDVLLNATPDDGSLARWRAVLGAAS